MAFEALPATGAGSAEAGRVVRASWGEQVRLNFDDHEERLQDVEASVGGVWRGTWDSATAYNAGDIVQHEGSSYRASVAIPVTSPVDEPGVSPSDWVLIAAAAGAGTLALDDLSDVAIGSPLADGDVLTYDSGSLLWVNSQPGGGALQEFLTAKSANETVNNSDTFQNDDHFSFAVAASEVWYIELTLLLESASTASDYKFQWTVPAGASYYFGPDLLGSTVAASVIYLWAPQTTGATPTALSTTLTALGSASSGVCGAVIRTILFVGGTAGTAQLQWAQNTITAADSKILRGSFMKRHRII